MKTQTTTQNAVLFVHGLTNSIGDKHWRNRLCLRDGLAEMGIASYEFDYRGRDSDKEHQCNFSLATATEDLDGILRHLHQESRHENIWLLGRGMAAFICLSSKEVQARNSPMVMWQPIFYPRRTMEKRGHIAAFQAYDKSDGHKYVELEGIRLAAPFFDHLEDCDPAKVWTNIRMFVLYTCGDKVSPSEWIDEFLASVKLAEGNKIESQVLDAPGVGIEHLHESEPERFITATLKLFRTGLFVPEKLENSR